jgi:sugar phosphate isomerase/epimerase
MPPGISRRNLLAGFAAVAFADSPRVRVGCQANAWPLEEGNFEQLLGALREMAEIGYTGFECNIRFVRSQFGNAAAARRSIEATGVRFIGAHTSLDAAADSKGDFEGVTSLGGERIVMSGRALSPKGAFLDEAAHLKAQRLSRMAQIARESGIRLAYHNHNDEFANGNAEVEALARLVGPQAMDFLVDAGHAYLGGGDPAAFLSKHHRRVFGVHIKTFRGNQQVPLGHGDFGFERLAVAIRETGWSGWIINEEGGGTKRGNTQAVRPDREYIRRVFGI